MGLPRPGLAGCTGMVRCPRSRLRKTKPRPSDGASLSKWRRCSHTRLGRRRQLLRIVGLADLLLALGHLDGHVGLLLVQPDGDLVTLFDTLVDDLLGHGILDELLDGTLQRAGAELLIVALLGQEVLR